MHDMKGTLVCLGSQQLYSLYSPWSLANMDVLLLNQSFMHTKIHCYINSHVEIYVPVQMMMNLLGFLVLVCLVNPWFILISLPVLTIIILLAWYSVRTTRSLQRIEAAREYTNI